MTKGVIQDWGLVEFFDPSDTELTQVALHGYILQGHSIRVHYCIPGVNAINIYMQVLYHFKYIFRSKIFGSTYNNINSTFLCVLQAVNAPPDPKKKALLNDQPTANVYSQLQKLASQNPACK